jgi:hypothetical protein
LLELAPDDLELVRAKLLGGIVDQLTVEPCDQTPGTLNHRTPGIVVQQSARQIEQQRDAIRTIAK